MTHDAKPNMRKLASNLRLHFMRVRNAEKGYLRQLMAVARQVSTIVKGLPDKPEVLVDTLERYAEVLDPWARATATRMVSEVERRDANAWNATAVEIGQNLRSQIESTPVGHAMQILISEQVEEIKSIPLEAAHRVFELATQAHTTGRRSSELAEQIYETQDITFGRAKMLARSAVSTASSTLVESRARYVGSPGYFWRTSKDSDVRKDHSELNGTFHTWDNPPIVDKRTGFRSHPGCNANCRCWPQVVLPEPDLN